MPPHLAILVSTSVSLTCPFIFRETSHLPIKTNSRSTPEEAAKDTGVKDMLSQMSGMSKEDLLAQAPKGMSKEQQEAMWKAFSESLTGGDFEVHSF